ncbi:MAG TPA: rRNA maturation RNase YbeY [Burkholderiales bacterium]|nr:rRNA maturation RNase YbeY [Burkholderiales bacterium]
MKKMVDVTVQYAVARKGLPSAHSVRRWTASSLGRTAAVTIRFVGAREARLLNKRYRGKDYATNVLSFPYESERLSGDLVLCAPVIAREAREQGKAVRDHYAHLIVHGLLHLQGWDHEHSAAAQKMEKREIAILASLGVSDPYVISA